MGINEKIVTGRKWRRLIDKDSKLWQLISWWTKASDVEFDDGKTAEQKLGNIDGITSDFSVDDESIAASSNLTNRAYNRFNEFTDNGKVKRIIIGEDGKPYIEYWDEDGADTVLKKLGEIEIPENSENAQKDIILKTSGYIAYQNYVKKSVTITSDHINEDYKLYVANISSAGCLNTAYAGIDTKRCYLGEGAVLLYSDNALGKSDFDGTTYGDIKTYTYIIPPQAIGTNLEIYIRGIYTINIFGIK